jgi:16S rRNA (guanine(966)-N(2))-methyltransferase RsmD
MPGIRVIAGKAKGRKLYMVPGDVARPARDLVKESLFNILGPDIQEASFLDLFAGTGSVGIEALSRGAGRVVFIDNKMDAIRTIHANLEITGLAGDKDVIHEDAFQYLASAPRETYDYVYIAPPQYLEMWEKATLMLDQAPEWLNQYAWVIVQINPDEYIDLKLDHLQEFDQRLYGSTLLVFYIYPGE